MKFSSFFALFLLATCCGKVLCQVYFINEVPHVTLKENAIISGSVRNSRDGRQFSAFTGIPYATIPARFQESELIRPVWLDGVKSFTEAGPVCSQQSFQGHLEGEEDCLNLNVYVSGQGVPDGYPVLIFIHGGGFSVGNGYKYGPTFFMDEDVILVTFNYRLGVFGGLSTGDHVISGNNGLKDIVIALKWIQEYIPMFGGNKDKLTVFGESAGSAAVHALMLSPSSKGLFHRAISQSASATTLLATDPDPKGNAIQLATYLKCSTTAMKESDMTSKEILACLKTVSAEDLNKAQFAFRECWPPQVRPFFFPPSPEPEGTSNAFLTKTPITILSDDNESAPIHDVPWLMGATEDEGATMYAGVVAEIPQLLQQLSTEWDSVAPVAFDYGRYPFTKDEIQEISQKIRKFYFGSDTEPITQEKHGQNLTNLFSDQLITHSVHKAAVETVKRGKGPVYLYQYAYPGPLSLMGNIFQLKGEHTKMVAHADDLQHLFDLSEDLFPGGSDAIKKGTADEEFSKNLVRLWVSFAVHGEPKHIWGSTSDDSPKWTPVSKEEANGTSPKKWFRIDANPRFIEEPYKERMQFWDDLFEKYFIPSLSSLGGRSNSDSATNKIEL